MTNIEMCNCPMCGANELTENPEDQIVPTLLGDVIAEVPVIRCDDCGYAWTDYRAEGIRETAVKQIEELRG